MELDRIQYLLILDTIVFLRIDRTGRRMQDLLSRDVPVDDLRRKVDLLLLGEFFCTVMKKTGKRALIWIRAKAHRITRRGHTHIHAVKKPLPAHLVKQRKTVLHEGLVHLVGYIHQRRILGVQVVVRDKRLHHVGNIVRFRHITIRTQFRRRDLHAVDLEKADLRPELFLEVRRFISGLSLIDPRTQRTQQRRLFQDLFRMVP